MMREQVSVFDFAVSTDVFDLFVSSPATPSFSIGLTDVSLLTGVVFHAAKATATSYLFGGDEVTEATSSASPKNIIRKDIAVKDHVPQRSKVQQAAHKLKDIVQTAQSEGVMPTALAEGENLVRTVCSEDNLRKVEATMDTAANKVLGETRTARLRKSVRRGRDAATKVDLCG